MITAPFNFVPLNEKVFFPLWAEDVSLDVPFKDGESGELDITITAKSPIFIRDNQNPEEFCQYNGQYYIPGSSVKGMVRNVLEIMSFSKLNKHNYDDDTYAVRDLSSAQNFYMKQMNLIDEPKTQCGWLKKSKDGYIIEDCGTPGRIHHNQIDYALNVKFASKFQNDGFKKTSKYKYDLVGGEIHTITVGEKYKSEKNIKYDKREFYKFDKNGITQAQLILTGQPTKRKNTGKMGDGKGFEFLFFDKKDELVVGKKVFENFLFAYFDKRTTEPKESPDWSYWKQKLNNGEKVPVFFQKNGKTILHFGLSYLYKLPYSHSIKDGIPKDHEDERLDLVQTIFGFINDKVGLKGRVQFSHFKATSNIETLQKRKEILGTPRASYYPIYIRQYNTDFKTYMDGTFSLAGRKRYPIHQGSKVVKTEDTGNENVGTTFIPLKEGVVFKGKLRYHNLKRCEIGAILSALTFHNTANTYHNIGMAKSLGYGKLELALDGLDDLSSYLKEFELYVTEQILEWKESRQLTELLSMAAEQNNNGNSTLQYMKLADFANNKSKSKDYLKCYTELEGINPILIDSLVTSNDMKELEKRNITFKKQQEKIQQLKKEQEVYQNNLQNAQNTDNIQIIKNFIAEYPEDENVKILQEKVEAIELEKKENKHAEVNKQVKSAYEALLKKKGTKSFKKDCDKFIKKWEAKKNNKGSDIVLEYVDKVKNC